MKSEIKQYLASIGKKGGEAGKGDAKARTSAQARAAAMKRWGKKPKTKQAKGAAK